MKEKIKDLEMNDVETLRKTLPKAAEELPGEKVLELIRLAESFAKSEEAASRRSRGPVLQAVSVSRLRELTGSVAWGGDALEDAERLYE